MLPFWVDWDYFQGCGCSGSMCNAKSPYKISTARTNSSVMARRTQAAIFVFSHGYSNESCWYWQDKTFPQLYFSKIDRYFYRLSASSLATFSDFDMSKKIKNNKNCVIFNTSMDGPSGKLSIAGLRSKIFAQQALGVKFKSLPDGGLCSILPVYMSYTHMYNV